MIASHYQQVTGDSGAGATIGPYKGRVTAVGGTVGYTFEVGQIPVSTQVCRASSTPSTSSASRTVFWLSGSQAGTSKRPGPPGCSTVIASCRAWTWLTSWGSAGSTSVRTANRT